MGKRGRGSFRGHGRGGARGASRGQSRGRGRGRGTKRGGTHATDPIQQQAVYTKEHVGRSGLGAVPVHRGGRGRRGRGTSTRGRGTSLAMTNQTHVPFDYTALRQPKRLPSATDPYDPSIPPPRQEFENARYDDDSGNEYDEEDGSIDTDDEDEENESEEDVAIVPHGRFSDTQIDRRRKLEGLVVNEFDIVTVSRTYDFDRALHHTNPLRRPIRFVPSSGADRQHTADMEAELVPDKNPTEASEVDRLASEAIALSQRPIDGSSNANPFEAPLVFPTSAPYDPPRMGLQQHATKQGMDSDPVVLLADDEPASLPTLTPGPASSETEPAAINEARAPAHSAPEGAPRKDLARDTQVADTPAVDALKEDASSSATASVDDLNERPSFVVTRTPSPVVFKEASPVVSPPRNPPRRTTRKRRGKKAKPFVREDSDVEWGSEGPPVEEKEGCLSLDLPDHLMTLDRRPVSEQEAILADWMENALRADDDDEEEEEEEEQDGDHPDEDKEKPSVSALCDPYGEQTTLEDIAIDAQLQEDVTWFSSDSERMANDEDEQMESGEEGEEDAGREDCDESLSTEAGLDEDIHAMLLDEIDMDGDLGPMGLNDWTGRWKRSKRNRKSMFECITQGDFSSDPFLGKTARKNRERPHFGSDCLWAEELQLQWEKDRSAKASKKKARQESRKAAELNPYPNTHGSRTKKEVKRLEKKARRAALKGFVEDVAVQGEEVLTPPSSFGAISTMIERFLADDGRTTLSLPPMLKHDRALVHNMADAYALKSRSRGKGKERFPVLYKTSKTGSRVDRSRIKRLARQPLGTMQDAQFDRDVKRGALRIGPDVAPRNREGARVGGNAKRISEDNIGHRLLASMGWQSGSGLGQSNGIAEPIGATIKVSRSGLGL